MLKDKPSLQLLTSFVLVYMVLAFGWWAIQLWRENDRIFDASYSLLEMQHGGPRRGLNVTELMATEEYRRLNHRKHKHRRMILAEGVFFTFCLGFGLYVINHSARREMELARQRRNFLLSITHELKSPIAAIRLTLDTLCKRELQREQLEKLCGNGLRDAGRLQHLVEDLLLAARLEDNWRPHVEPLDLRRIALDCTANLRTRFPKAVIRIDIPDTVLPIPGDKSGMTAVIQNLLENAVKYAPEGAPVELSVEQSNGKTVLRVADLGVGIPDAEKKAVFEKFYRIGNEDTRQTTGTGLGLYIVSQVVQAHGGSITLTDNQPKGTVFTIQL